MIDFRGSFVHIMLTCAFLIPIPNFILIPIPLNVINYNKSCTRW